MRTTLTSKAMTSNRQEEMVSLLSYLEENGFNKLGARIRKEKLSAREMTDLVFAHPGEFRGEDVYVLYLEDMIWKVPPMAYFGTWDFESRKSDSMGYIPLECPSMVNNVMTCSDGTVDLNRGFMSDGSMDIPLRSVFFVNNGDVVDERHYDAEEGYYLQVFAKDNNVDMILVADERLFRTNFNQQFLLGKYDRRYFEEVYNEFPVARVLKVKKSGSAEAGR
jgi:dolichyl-diphosphooligosaccharide--protein glycosyltransferase